MVDLPLALTGIALIASGGTCTIWYVTDLLKKTWPRGSGRWAWSPAVVVLALDDLGGSSAQVLFC